MVNWNNLDTLASYQALKQAKRVNLVEGMSGESGAGKEVQCADDGRAGL